MMENINQQIKKQAALNGLLFGAISLVLSIFLFYFITSMVTNPIMITIGGPLIFSFLIPLGIAIFFCFDLRKKTGGFWSFRQAATGIFIMFFTAYLVSYLGNQVFSKAIEPDMVEKMKAVFVRTTTTVMEKRGADQDAIDKQVANIETSFNEQKNPSVGVIAKGFGLAIVMYFVIALVFAAFFKRERLLPVGDDNPEMTDPTA